MNVLSTFNGMGVIWAALEKIWMPVTNRYSSETDKWANIINMIKIIRILYSWEM
jgi:hypothetical protein